MNPAFIIIVGIAVVVIWFLAAGLYKPIGKLIHKITHDVFDVMKEDDEKET